MPEILERSPTKFDADYFLNGEAKGLSNYSDFRWLPDLTIPMATQAQWLLGIKPNEIVYEIGAARGYFIKALRMLGIEAWGMDVSEWAVQNCDPAVKEYLCTELSLPEKGWDLVWCKDVLEHIPVDELEALIPRVLKATRRMFFIIVPLALTTGGAYGCPVDEADATHVIRWTLPTWLEFLQKQSKDFVVSGSYEMPVLKPNCYEYPRSYGFIQVRRVRP